MTASQTAGSEPRKTGGTGTARRRLTRPMDTRRRWPPLLTVQGWLRVVFVGLALLALASVIAITQLLAEGRHVGSDLNDDVLPAQAQAYRLQGALVNQETGVRGFVITGQADFLQPYTSGLATEADAAARIRAEIGGDQQLAADLAALQRAAVSWRKTYAMPLIALGRKGPISPKDTAFLDRSKGSFDRLRTLFTRQNQHLAAAAAHDQARVSSVRTTENWAFVVIVVAFVLAAASLSLALSRAVVRPLTRLRAASRRVVDGDFEHHIAITGPTDLRAVAVDVEAMRSELVRVLDEARVSQRVAAQQAADLDVKAAELERSNAELEQFAYVASHDLQEPLRKVASFCQLLEKRYGDQLDDRGRQYINFAVDGAKRLQVLINDLLTFSRVGRGNRAPERLALDRPLDLAISGIAGAVEEAAAVIERPGPLPEVMGDETLLAMLWQNLISNGIKFRAPDRPPVVRITATVLASTVLSSTESPDAESPDAEPADAEPADAEPPEPGPLDGEEPAGGQPGMWRFCVTDNGIGIPPEFAEKVFIIFQRLHGRDAYPGTGIGLALCRRIVEYHGGQISIDEGYTGGTRICFTLPQLGTDPDQPDPGQSGAGQSDTGQSDTGQSDTGQSSAGQPGTDQASPATAR